MVVGLHHVVDLDDVGLVQQLQDLDLPSDGLLPLRLPNLRLLVHLYCDLLIQRFVYGHSHRGIGALADDLADQVILLELHSQVFPVLE